MTKIEKLEKQFAKVAQEIYEAGDGRLETTWPWVLVRLCPKEMKVGEIWTPGDYFSGNLKQNSPLYEGIVMVTWKPHWSKFRKYSEHFKDGDEVWRESDFKVGDRVLFPGWAGLQPPKFLDEKKYRLVREWTFDPNGGAMCVIHYDQDKKMREKLEDVFAETTACGISGK